jgi:hypothetical protein
MAALRAAAEAVTHEAAALDREESG